MENDITPNDTTEKDVAHQSRRCRLLVSPLNKQTRAGEFCAVNSPPATQPPHLLSPPPPLLRRSELWDCKAVMLACPCVGRRVRFVRDVQGVATLDESWTECRTIAHLHVKNCGSWASVQDHSSTTVWLIG
ncbi:hypothetical protein BaRGS_00030685 [Batillaria attramentaria]|uniref:Uncharacterized protein n=1 Tax=Batillaria attramentaria TaxID=370345 RepID=A0ABD0JTQ9_9CAEN